MRILTRKIYRAFPELDRYDDERCERFVRAARRGWLRRALRFVIICVVLWGSSVVAALPIAYMSGYFDRASSHSWILVLVSMPLIGIPVVAALLTRDYLLRRRVRYVLRTRGTCHGCRYSLIGLPVDEKNFVTCPECGAESEVDSALGELVMDDTGKRRYQPSPASLPRPPRIFTAARVRKIKRYGLIIAFLLAVGLPAVWGGYEFWLRRQASMAASERPGPEGFVAYIKKSQPPGVGGDAPNAWDAFHKAQKLVEAADGRLWRPPATSPSVPYFDFILSNRKPSDDPAQAASDAACVALAYKCMDAYRADGVFDLLNEMAACPRAEMDISFSLNQSSVDILLPELGQARNFARINGARMKLAAAAHDLKEFTEATEANFALARICRMQPFLIDSLVGIAIEALNYSRLREVLASHPDSAWLDAVDGAIQRQGYSLARKDYFEGERLAVLDTTAWMFADPSMVRRRQFSPSMMNMFGSSAPGRLGSYSANRDEFNDRFDAMSKYVALERWERVAPKPDLSAPSSLMMVNFMMPAIGSAVKALDQLDLDRRSYVVLAALERYRIAHGEYPPALAALTPDLLKQLPLDPWSGKPFGYLRLDKPDEQGREYLLYSVGADGVDNGGKEAPGEDVHYEVLTGDFVKPGFDFIINDKNR